MTPEPADLPEYVLDGASFDDLAGFFTAIGQTLGVSSWGRNLDAFNDILRGGFGAESADNVHLILALAGGGFVHETPAYGPEAWDEMKRRTQAAGGLPRQASLPETR